MENKTTPIEDGKFTKYSINMFVLTLGLTFLLSLVTIFSSILPHDFTNKIAIPIIYIFTFSIPTSSFIGVIMSILSFVKKETSTWSKWISSMINFSIFFLICSIIKYMIFSFKPYSIN